MLLRAVALRNFKRGVQPTARLGHLSNLAVVAGESERQQRFVREVVDCVEQERQRAFDATGRHPARGIRAPCEHLGVIRQKPRQSLRHAKRHLMLVGLVEDPPAQFQHVGPGALSRRQLLQFLVGAQEIAEFNPALGGADVLLSAGVRVQCGGR